MPDIGRAAAIACLASFSAAGIVSAADRYSAIDPAASALVPAGVAATAARVGAEQALTNGDIASASALAQRAVRASPADGEALALLGRVHLSSGDARGAEAAFAQAANAGWRQPATQAYAFERALALGRADRAALHLDALLRTLPGDARVRAGIDRLLAADGGADALFQRLEYRPRWRSALLGETARIDAAALVRRSDVVSRALRLGFLTCSETRVFRSQAGARGIASEGCP